MHKRNIILVLIFTAVIYSNCLSNGFVRDDKAVFVYNNFYRSWDNFPKIFKKDFIFLPDKVFFNPANPEGNLGSGVVSFRPVTALTFFNDSSLWKDNPFGFHLTNLILHIFCSILAYLLVAGIVKNPSVALFGSLLFAVHPINSEVVCNITLRSDILAFLFFLISFLSFIKAGKRGFLKIMSLASYGIALFSKESAIVLPALLMAYDFYFTRDNTARIFSNIKSKYLGYVVITFFYIYVYLFVFSNSTFNALAVFDNSFIIHAMTIAKIFLQYVVGIVLPNCVYILPGLYRPSVIPVFSIGNIFAVILFILWIFAVVKTYKREKFISFFLLWFWIGFIPVSNIVPIANPMAYRFMYLPSLGLLVVIALCVDKLNLLKGRFKQLPTLPKIARALMAGFCMVITFTLSGMWRSDHTVALAMVKYFPENPLGHYALGVEYFNAQVYDKAIESLNMGLEKGLEDPRVFYLLGMCHRNDLAAMKKYFEKALEMRPDYVYPYYALGYEYMIRQDYEKALPYLKKSLEISPQFVRAYKSLIVAQINVGRPDNARETLEKAKSAINDKKDLEDLLGFVSDMGGDI